MTSNINNNGDENVIIGNIGNRSINGSRNVIIGATDSNGNTILNRPMIIGNNAKGGPNDIVIGSNAGSGSDLFLLLDRLKQTTSNQDLINNIKDLSSALEKPQENNDKIQKLWGSIEKSVTAGSAIDLVAKIVPIISSLFGK